MPRFECECRVDCYLEEDEIEAKDEDEAERIAWKNIRFCDIEPECECIETNESESG